MSGPDKELGAELSEIEKHLQEIANLLNTPEVKADHTRTNYLQRRIKWLTAEKTTIEKLQSESGSISADNINNLNETETDKERDTDR